MNAEEFQPYLDWIDTQSQHMTLLTEQWSRINSGSYHLEGLARMLKALEDNFLWLGGEIERIPLSDLEEVNNTGEVIRTPMGDALRIRKRPDAPVQVFLGGHMDTVFGKDHPFQEPEYIKENILNGPGVADLKGGLVVMLKALEAVERSPWAENIGYEIVLNPDEEIGSQCSDYLFKEAASRNQLGFIYEPALADGTLAGARKGSGNFTFVIRGQAAHAGREFDKGRNAIMKASEVALTLFDLNGQRDGVTLNLGRIEGGGPLNMVPDLAMVRFNVRLPSEEDRDWMDQELVKIIDKFSQQEGFSIEKYGKFTRHPKPMHPRVEKVFEFVKDSGAMIAQDVAWNATGGCCDGNNLWSYGLPNVDTLGVRGAHIHSSDEIVYLDSLAERAKLSAVMLMRLAKGDVVFS